MNQKRGKANKTIQLTNNESKKRDLYSVICVCENDFCTFQKRVREAKKWRISILISKSIRKKINIEKLLLFDFYNFIMKKIDSTIKLCLVSFLSSSNQ